MEHTAPTPVEFIVRPKLRLKRVPRPIAQDIAADARNGAVAAVPPVVRRIGAAGRRLQLEADRIGRAFVRYHPLLTDIDTIDRIGVEQVLSILLIQRLLLNEWQ